MNMETTRTDDKGIGLNLNPKIIKTRTQKVKIKNKSCARPRYNQIFIMIK
jgi:hypothetical protein